MKKTLTQLIHITGHTDEDFAILAEHADHGAAWADGFVTDFYDTLFDFAPTNAVFREGERPDREATFRAWLLDVTSGKISSDFWNRQWIVGLLHIQRHVSNTFMLAMTSRMQRSFLDYSLAHLDANAAGRLIGAFQRVTDIVAGLIAEGFHQGYTEAVADVTGMRGALLDRMADVAIGNLLEKARANL